MPFAIVIVFASSHSPSLTTPSMVIDDVSGIFQ